MSERILIGTGQATNQKGDIIDIKIYLGNVVELPDGSQTSLSDEQYAKVLERWNREQVKIEEVPVVKEDNIQDEKQLILETPGPDIHPEEKSSSRPINIQYFNEKSGTLSDTPPEKDDCNTEKASDIEIKTDNNEEIISQKSEKTDKKLINIFIAGFIILLLAGGYLVFKIIYPSLDNYALNGIASTNPSPTVISEKIIVKVTQDISQGDIFTGDMITDFKISEDEFDQMNAATYISADGKTTNSTLITAEKREDIIGKFATRNIPKGTYLTLQDYSSQKVIAEKTFVEVEVDGQTISVPVDATSLTGNTRVKIVALITTDNQDDTIAIALSEFILEDRTLSDIFDSAGQSILAQLAGQSSDSNQ